MTNLVNNPFFNVYIGPMFGSKTTRLLSDIDRFKYKQKKIIAFKPKIDQRYSKQQICSHSGAKYDAICISSGCEIYDYILNNKYDIIAVDEAFMIKCIDEVLIDLYEKKYSIIVSSIQLSGENKPFENIKNILPWATKIEICPAVCTQCDNDAFFTKALFDMSNIESSIKIGNSDIYEPRCHLHNF